MRVCSSRAPCGAATPSGIAFRYSCLGSNAKYRIPIPDFPMSTTADLVLALKKALKAAPAALRPA